MPFEAEALADELLRTAEEMTARAMVPVLARLERAEAQVEILVALTRAPKDGENGQAGPQGERGADGAPGRDGADGAPGADGNEGPQGERGPQGEPGPQGERGADGADGAPGAVGKAGSQGERGPQGEPGMPGERGPQGEPGPQGERGADGVPGRDGADGAPGADGKEGLQGERGPEGLMRAVRDWADAVHYAGDIVTHAGATWQAETDTGHPPPHADWRCLAAAGRDGRSVQHRGTYDAESDYKALDAVITGGSSFVALRDNPGACPGEGWQLWASRGSKGPQGERGERGLRGEAGQDAPALLAAVVDAKGVLTLTLEDGREVTADFGPWLGRG